jgi:hypothetical protein
MNGPYLERFFRGGSVKNTPKAQRTQHPSYESEHLDFVIYDQDCRSLLLIR